MARIDVARLRFGTERRKPSRPPPAPPAAARPGSGAAALAAPVRAGSMGHNPGPRSGFPRADARMPPGWRRVPPAAPPASGAAASAVPARAPAPAPAPARVRPGGGIQAPSPWRSRCGWSIGGPIPPRPCGSPPRAKALAGDIRFIERRRHAAQLRHQRRPRALIERTSGVAGILVETGNCMGNERVVVGHGSPAYAFGAPIAFTMLQCDLQRDLQRDLQWAQSSNGLCIRIVSSRSGLVDSKATGQPTSSSMRRTYLIAGAGSSAQERARAVGSRQPATVS